jgi:hypothetical protein
MGVELKRPELPFCTVVMASAGRQCTEPVDMGPLVLAAQEIREARNRRSGTWRHGVLLTLRDWFSPERSPPGHGYDLVAE